MSRDFQASVSPWMQQCFGPEISADITERNHRFLEEALELVQSSGCTAGRGSPACRLRLRTTRGRHQPRGRRRHGYARGSLSRVRREHAWKPATRSSPASGGRLSRSGQSRPQSRSTRHCRNRRAEMKPGSGARHVLGRADPSSWRKGCTCDRKRGNPSIKETLNDLRAHL